MWFNSPGQQTGGMWGGNGPQAPQINNAPQGPMWGGQPSLQPLGGMGLPQLPPQAPMSAPPAYGAMLPPQAPAYGQEGLLPNEGWQRFGSPTMPQPSGPREAPEAHPGMADQQAGQWAAPGGGGLFGDRRDSSGYILDRNGNPIPDTGPGGIGGPRMGGGLSGPTLGQWASTLTARR